jgi:hypothetical protein
MSNSNVGATATTTYTIDDLYDVVKDTGLYSVERLQEILSQPTINPNDLRQRGHKPAIIYLAKQFYGLRWPNEREQQKEKMKLFLEHPNINPTPDGADAYSVVGEVASQPNPELLKILLDHPKTNINSSSTKHALDAAIETYERVKEGSESTLLFKYNCPLDRNCDKRMLENIDMIINHPHIDRYVLKGVLGRHADPLIQDKIKKRLDTMLPRGIAELANKEKLPPEITSKIFEMATGKKASMEDYDTRQFLFKQKQELDALIEKHKKQREERQKILDARNPNLKKGGRKTRRKPTSARYSRFGKTRSS